MIFISVVLPPPDGPMMVMNSPGSIVMLISSKTTAPCRRSGKKRYEAQCGPNLPRVSEGLVVPALEWGQRDVRQTFQVEPEDPKIERLLNQLDGPFNEMLLVAHKREDHADGECIAERERRSQIDRDDVFKAKDRVVEGGEHDFRPAQANVRAHHLAVAVEPRPSRSLSRLRSLRLWMARMLSIKVELSWA